MSEITISTKNFESEILSSDKPCIVDFWADWCMPCKMIAPTIAEIAEENDNIKVGKVNVDDEPELCEQFGITNIPTLVIFKNGAVVKKSIGVKSKEAILSLLS